MCSDTCTMSSGCSRVACTGLFAQSWVRTDAALACCERVAGCCGGPACRCLIRPSCWKITGENALIMPDIWVFNIDPKHGEPKGWGPHRDRPSAQPIMADGRAASINFWLPLTEATTLNGCMYILPKQFDDRDPHSPAWQNLPKDRIPERDAPRMKQLQYVVACGRMLCILSCLCVVALRECGVSHCQARARVASTAGRDLRLGWVGASLGICRAARSTAPSAHLHRN